MKGFRDFLLRGNVIDLAVAVVIGAAFTAIVTSVVTNLITPLLGALFQSDSLDNALVVAVPTLTHSPARLRFGAVLGAVINFVIVAAVVYFAIVLPAGWATKRAFRRRQQSATATPVDAPPTETELLIEIRDLLAGRPSPEGDHAPPGARPAVPPS